jgi:hypothetical protein
MKIRESAASIYDEDIVPLEDRPMIIDIYVKAMRVVFLMTVGFVILNTIAGSFMEEHHLHDNLERRADAGETESDADGA